MIRPELGFNLYILMVSALWLALHLSACTDDADALVLFERGDYDRALTAFQVQADAGDLNAINYIGIHYYIGAGVKRDLQRAAAWFERAALLGHPAAQKNLGVMYYRGLGIKQNYERAFGWMYYARAGGNSEAQKYIDLMQYNITVNAIPGIVDMIREQLENKQSLIDEDLK